MYSLDYIYTSFSVVYLPRIPKQELNQCSSIMLYQLFFVCVQGLLREIHSTLIINLDKWVPNFSGLAIIGAFYDPLIRDIVV
jgi:hypothetical protein